MSSGNQAAPVSGAPRQALLQEQLLPGEEPHHRQLSCQEPRAAGHRSCPLWCAVISVIDYFQTIFFVHCHTSWVKGADSVAEVLSCIDIASMPCGAHFIYNGFIERISCLEFRYLLPQNSESDAENTALHFSTDQQFRIFQFKGSQNS